MSAEAPEAVESIRDAGESLRTFVDRLRESASVESVYGEPIETAGKTVVPVARVAYGFGGGFGSSEGEEGEGAAGEGAGGEGAGVGGGVAASPVGALEITEAETRFVRFADRRRQVAALAVGLLVGVLLGRRRGGP